MLVTTAKALAGAQFSRSGVQQSTSLVPKPRPAASTEKPGNEASINKVIEISFLWGSLYNEIKLQELKRLCYSTFPVGNGSHHEATKIYLLL